jgi:hypothetical protein
MSRSYNFSPPWRLHGAVGQVYFALLVAYHDRLERRYSTQVTFLVNTTAWNYKDCHFGNIVQFEEELRFEISEEPMYFADATVL